MGTLDGIVAMMSKRSQSLKNLFDFRVFLEVAMARQA